VRTSLPLRVIPVAAFVVGALHGVGCSPARNVGGDARSPAAPPATSDEAGVATATAPAPSSTTLPPLPLPLPPLPAPPESPAHAALLDDPHVPYRGANPFEPAPSAPATAATPAPPAARYFEREETRIRARMADLMKGLSAEGMPIDTSVVGVDTRVGGDGRVVRVVRIPVHRGSCYGVVFRESYDLDLSLNATSAIEANYFDEGGDWVAVYEQSAAITPFCPQDSGFIVVRLMLDHRDPLPSVARGAFRMQLFRKTIADADLRAQAEKYEDERRRGALQYVCAYCARVNLACQLSGEPQCTGQFVACLRSVGVGADDCERGDLPRPPKPKAPFDT
jgi:hypothetical protein